MARSFLTKYFIVLALLTALTTSGYFIVQHLITIQEDNSSLVTMSGNQLMLSQRIVTTAVGLLRADDEATRQGSASLLQTTVETMANAHALLTGEANRMSEIMARSTTLRDIYYAQPYLLDQQVKRFLQQARELLTAKNDRARQYAIDAILSLSGGNLSEGLSLAVRQYQAEVAARIKSLEDIRLGILAAVYVLLALDGLIIFRPLLRVIGKGERELAALREKLEAQATSDPLTRVMNRKAMGAALERELAGVQRYGGDLALLLLDVNDFRNINARHGQNVGDRLLQEVALLVQNNVRQTDYVFRSGGAEFAVLTVSTSLEGALLLADKLIGLIKANSFHERIRLTARAGVACHAPGETADQFAARAADAVEEARLSDTFVAEAAPPTSSP